MQKNVNITPDRPDRKEFGFFEIKRVLVIKQSLNLRICLFYTLSLYMSTKSIEEKRQQNYV